MEKAGYFSYTCMQIGGIGALIPHRRNELAQLGLRAMLEHHDEPQNSEHRQHADHVATKMSVGRENPGLRSHKVVF